MLARLDNAMRDKNYSQIYDLLADPNFDANATGRCNWTPLLTAADMGDVKMVEIFLKMGANLNSRVNNNKNHSALDIVVIKACGIYIDELSGKFSTPEIPHGFDPQRKDQAGGTPISCAKYAGHKDIVEFLEKHHPYGCLLHRGSILTRDVYSACKSDNMRLKISTAKIQQLEILKKELSLPDKNPSHFRF